MKRILLGLFVIVPACVVQTEGVSGIKGDKGDPGEPATDGDADLLDGIDGKDFMRADVNTGTLGSIFVKGGALIEGEQADAESATVSVRQSNPTFGGSASIVNIDAESDAGGWYFLRARNVDTPADGGTPTTTDKFLLANDGTVVTWGNIGVGTTAPKAPLHIQTSAIGPAIVLDASAPTGGALSLQRDGSQMGVVGSSGAIEGNASEDVGIFAETGHQINFYTNGSAQSRVTISKNGSIGIGTSQPVANLDVVGTARLTRYSAPPSDCDATTDGTIAMTHIHTLCICNGSVWVKSSDGTSPCAW